jgi:hypothetical protein
VVEDTLASVEAVVRTQDKQGFRLLDKPKSFYFHDKSSGNILILYKLFEGSTELRTSRVLGCLTNLNHSTSTKKTQVRMQ